MEKTIKSKTIYNGKIIDVYKDEVVLINNKIATRELVKHPGGVCIAVCNSNHQYALVNQFRYGANQMMWEFPAGKLEKNEIPLKAIEREVEEEIGYQAINIMELGYIIPSGAYLDEKIYLYSGDIGQYTGQNLDDDEILTIKWMTLDEIKSMIDDNEIVDAKTIALTYKLSSKIK